MQAEEVQFIHCLCLAERRTGFEINRIDRVL